MSSGSVRPTAIKLQLRARLASLSFYMVSLYILRIYLRGNKVNYTHPVRYVEFMKKNHHYLCNYKTNHQSRILLIPILMRCYVHGIFKIFPRIFRHEITILPQLMWHLQNIFFQCRTMLLNGVSYRVSFFNFIKSCIRIVLCITIRYKK